MDAGTLRPASPPRRASVSGAPKNEASAGGSAGTSAAAREPETYRQDVIPWSNADPTRRVRSALHPRTIPRPTHLAPRRPTNRMCRMRRDRWKTRNAPRTRAPRRPTHLSPLSSPPFFLSKTSRLRNSRGARAPAQARDDRLDRRVQAHQPQLLRDALLAELAGRLRRGVSGRRRRRGRELSKPRYRRDARRRLGGCLGAALGDARRFSAPLAPAQLERGGQAGFPHIRSEWCVMAGFPAGRVMAGLRRIGTRRRRARRRRRATCCTIGTRWAASSAAARSRAWWWRTTS